MLNQRAIGNHRFSSLALIKAVSNANLQTIAYCDETDTLYRFESSGSAYTANDQDVLTTGAGGNTRWLGIAGRYVFVASLKSYYSEYIAATSTSSTAFVSLPTPVTFTLPKGKKYQIIWSCSLATNNTGFPSPEVRLIDVTGVNALQKSADDNAPISPGYLKAHGGMVQVDLTAAGSDNVYELDYKKISGTGTGDVYIRWARLSAIEVR